MALLTLKYYKHRWEFWGIYTVAITEYHRLDEPDSRNLRLGMRPNCSILS